MAHPGYRAGRLMQESLHNMSVISRLQFLHRRHRGEIADCYLAWLPDRQYSTNRVVNT